MPPGVAPLAKNNAPYCSACQRHADGVLGHGDRTIADESVKPKPRNMQHLILRQDNLLAAVIRTELVRVLGVGVNKLTVRGSADIHLAGKQWVQCNRLPGAVPDDLRIGIAP